MASVDLKLPIAYVENVARIKVVNGTPFDLILKRTEGDYEGPVDYASTGDPVLEIKAGEIEEIVTIKAKTVGLSKFFFIEKTDSGIVPIKEVRIEVVTAIADLAVDLGLTGEVIDN
jgi:hypothetical protein